MVGKVRGVNPLLSTIINSSHMIVDTMTSEELQNEVKRMMPGVIAKANPYASIFLRKHLKQLNNKPIYWKEHNEIIVKGNKILLYYYSTDGTVRHFCTRYFMYVNSKEGRELYMLATSGSAWRLSHHFIKRFCERVGCDRKNVIFEMIKELPDTFKISTVRNYSYVHSKNGLMVIALENTLVTYMNQLSTSKTWIKEYLEHEYEIYRKYEESRLQSHFKCAF